MNNSGDTKDTTPLWGGAQYSYPDHARAEPSTLWANHPMHPMAHASYNGFHGMREDINYTELKPEHIGTMGESDSALPEAYPRAMAYIQQQQQYQQYQQQQQLAGGAPPIPQENPPFLHSLAAFQENRGSPDLGYSSPPPPPEFFGPHYQAHRGQVPPAGEYSMASYHQNAMSSGEPPMMGVPVKQEAVEAPVSYSKQLELIVKHVDDSKPIIHANIQLCPPRQFAPSSQVQSYPQQGGQPEPIKVNISLPQQAPRAEQHAENDKYELMSLDEQPPKAIQHSVIVSAPARPTPSPKKSPARAKKSPPKPTVKPEDRRSVRPSAIEHSEFECLKCGEFFARKCGLTQHDKWIHTERVHQCTWCGKYFATTEQLAQHEVRHDQVDKSFKCEKCEKQYCHKNDLRRHMYRHDRVSPHACTLCERVFVRADHLTNHIATHERRQRLAEEREAKPKPSPRPRAARSKKD